jgi:hypothetical protein
MLKKVRYIFAVMAFVMLLPIPSFAACHRAHVCDDYGQNCQYQDICDNTLDLPSVEIDPIPSLPTTQIKPLPSVGLPPLGTSHCEYMQVNGRWQNVCQ